MQESPQETKDFRMINGNSKFGWRSNENSEIRARPSAQRLRKMTDLTSNQVKIDLAW